MTRCTSKTQQGRRCGGHAIAGCTTCSFHTPAVPPPPPPPPPPTFAEISAAVDALLEAPIADTASSRADQLCDTDLLMAVVWNWGYNALQYGQVLLINRLRERMHALAAIDA